MAHLHVETGRRDRVLFQRRLQVQWLGAGGRRTVTADGAGRTPNDGRRAWLARERQKTPFDESLVYRSGDMSTKRTGEPCPRAGMVQPDVADRWQMSASNRWNIGERRRLARWRNRLWTI